MKMKKYLILLVALLVAFWQPAASQPQKGPQPLYIVNGKVMEDIHTIPPSDIEQMDELPADEETIARYGQKASNGVLIITLKYDEPAKFQADSTFGSYIAREVKWDKSEPAARVALRYTITPEGKTVIGQILESTDSRLKRRVLKAVEEAPAWQPAQKAGKPVASEGVLNLQLPAGKSIPRLPDLIIR